MLASGVLLAAGIALPAVSGDDAPLEPSVQNEVDHALCLGEKWLEDFARTNSAAGRRAAGGACATNSACATNGVPSSAPSPQCGAGDLFATNSLGREQIALKLVRTQRAGGFWLDPRDASATNRVPVERATRLAVSILSAL